MVTSWLTPVTSWPTLVTRWLFWWRLDQVTSLPGDDMTNTHHHNLIYKPRGTIRPTGHSGIPSGRTQTQPARRSRGPSRTSFLGQTCNPTALFRNYTHNGRRSSGGRGRGSTPPKVYMTWLRLPSLNRHRDNSNFRSCVVIKWRWFIIFGVIITHWPSEYSPAGKQIWQLLLQILLQIQVLSVSTQTNQVIRPLGQWGSSEDTPTQWVVTCWNLIILNIKYFTIQ